MSIFTDTGVSTFAVCWFVRIKCELTCKLTYSEFAAVSLFDLLSFLFGVDSEVWDSD